MYLDRAKKHYEKMLQLTKWTLYHKPCSSEDIEEIKEVLNLQLPDSYEEFLRWVGKGWGLIETPGGFYSTREWKLRDTAIEIMEENGATEPLPEDAIVFVILEESYSFAFLRASEGDDPPIHWFPGIMKGEDGKYYDYNCFIWNWFPNLGELCIAWIKNYW